MNIKKIIAAVLCLSVLVSKTASGHDIIGQNQTEVTLMASASEAKEVIKILPATVNSEYKQVLVAGSTTHMDEGTVYRGLALSPATIHRACSWITKPKTQRLTGR